MVENRDGTFEPLLRLGQVAVDDTEVAEAEARRGGAGMVSPEDALVDLPDAQEELLSAVEVVGVVLVVIAAAAVGHSAIHRRVAIVGVLQLTFSVRFDESLPRPVLHLQARHLRRFPGVVAVCFLGLVAFGFGEQALDLASPEGVALVARQPLFRRASGQLCTPTAPLNVLLHVPKDERRSKYSRKEKKQREGTRNDRYVAS